ncbi:hypothetical protein EcCFBP13530_23725 [Enterobacter cancerogenus]|uniref:DUF1187 family protein n=1 Tax=Enterobacter cancerogenus TaxID=69218 RepID=A0AB38NXI2_9ENTR|nr:hypothetical protein EcCFBP13530_23725 [Enterobacter cancerogenus]
MYIIKATIVKPGSMPVEWTRYSPRPMTIKETILLISPSKKEIFKTHEKMKISILDFTCSRLEDR